MYTPKKRKDIYYDSLCNVMSENMCGICSDLINYCDYLPQKGKEYLYGIENLKSENDVHFLGFGTFPEFDLFLPDLNKSEDKFGDEDRMFVLQICIEMTKK
jgi:hypothetical protein